MLFLSEYEKTEWADYAREIIKNDTSPSVYEEKIRTNLYSAFCYFIGTTLAARGNEEQSIAWLKAGALTEEEGLFSSTFLLGFLQRHNKKMVAPTGAFTDPRPFIHFASVPSMKDARSRFVQQCSHTLPVFKNPIRFMDIGCGDGALTVRLLHHLLDTGKVTGLAEILLVDSSPAMIALAHTTVSEAFPNVPITTENARIQDCSATIDHHYDITMSSLAYHHMPLEDKREHLARLKPWIDHFILFEMDANNDTPELYSPDLAFSVYQSYGRIMDFVYAHDAPVDVVTNCIDSFMMIEVVSMLTKPRGVRSDYHMLRNQWNDLFRSELGPEFTVRCDSACYADEYMTLFTMHYGREKRGLLSK
jgi:SAM-dependent methyltransferase